MELFNYIINAMEQFLTNPMALALTMSLLFNIVIIWNVIIKPSEPGVHSLATFLLTKNQLSKQLIEVKTAFEVCDKLREVAVREHAELLKEVQDLKYTIRIQEHKYKFLTEGLEKELWLLINDSKKLGQKPMLVLHAFDEIIASHLYRLLEVSDDIAETLRAGINYQMSAIVENEQRLIRDKSMYDEKEYRNLHDIYTSDKIKLNACSAFVEKLLSQYQAVKMPEVLRPMRSMTDEELKVHHGEEN